MGIRIGTRMSMQMRTRMRIVNEEEGDDDDDDDDKCDDLDEAAVMQPAILA